MVKWLDRIHQKVDGNDSGIDRYIENENHSQLKNLGPSLSPLTRVIRTALFRWSQFGEVSEIIPVKSVF